MNVPPVPECRDMVAAACAFVEGEIHFSALIEPIQNCQIWARVHNSDAAILKLTSDWLFMVDQTWNEFGQHDEAMSVEQLRSRIAADLRRV